MVDDIFSERRRALEESFFAKRNHELLEKLREQYSQEEEKDQLRKVSGIQDEAVLNHLIAAGIRRETFAALALAPLVFLAWADDFVDPKERHLILEAAAKDGMEKQDHCFRLVESWLAERPDNQLLEDWKAYIQTLRKNLPGETVAQVHQQVIGRARRVAEAAGKMFFYGNPVSAAEEAVLNELEQAFTGS
jgi:hypothetical protein